MSKWDLLLTDARIATMREGATDYGEIDDGAAKEVRRCHIERVRKTPGDDRLAVSECGERQVPDADVGLTHNVGGTGQTCVVHIFERR